MITILWQEGYISSVVKGALNCGINDASRLGARFVTQKCAFQHDSEIAQKALRIAKKSLIWLKGEETHFRFYWHFYHVLYDICYV